MFKKFTLSLLSFVSFATVAHGAGDLVLETEFSEEQRAAFIQKFVVPYQEFQRENPTFTRSVIIDKIVCRRMYQEESDKTFSYPALESLEGLKCETGLFTNIEEEHAHWIAKELINIARGEYLELLQETFVHTSTDDHNCIGDNPRHLSILLQVEDKPIRKWLKRAQEQFYETKAKNFEAAVSPFADLSYLDVGQVTFSQDLLYEDVQMVKKEMANKIKELAGQTAPLKFKPTKFSLKFVDNDVVKFSIPFDLTPNVSQ